LSQGVGLWFFTIAPLFYILLMGITSTGAYIVITLKFLSPFLLGVLGLIIYLYANKTLTWSPKKSLLVALFATLYFVSMRISWDMLRVEFALIFLFVMLILLQKNEYSVKNGVLLSLIMILIVVTNQLVAILMFVLLIGTYCRLLYCKKNSEKNKLMLIILPALIIFSSMFYIDFFGNPYVTGDFASRYSGGLQGVDDFTHAEWAVNNLGFLAFCYLPLILLLLLGVRRFKGNIQLNSWILFTLIILLLAIIAPYSIFASVIPYRWVLLLTFPLAFYTAEGFVAIKYNSLKIGAILILAILSLGFIALPVNEAFFYYEKFPEYVPKSMLQNTLQLSDCQDALNALSWLRDNMSADGYLLVHGAFYGWAALKVNYDQLIVYDFLRPEIMVEMLKKDSSLPTELYLIWWINGSGWYGQPTVDSSFFEIYRSGEIAVYNYVQPIG
jgi:hypothetical protein